MSCAWTDAVTGRDVADRRGKQVRVLTGGQVTAGEGQDLGAGNAFASGGDLPVLVWILLAAAEVDRNGAGHASRDLGKIPALRVTAVLADETGGAVQERRTFPPGDCRPHLIEFGASGTVATGVHTCLDHRLAECPRRPLHASRASGTQRGAQQRGSLPWVRVRIGEQAAVDHEHGADRRGSGALKLAAQQFEYGERGVVEGDHDGGADTVLPP